jgi:polysaccharide export outer membrane protein
MAGMVMALGVTSADTAQAPRRGNPEQTAAATPAAPAVPGARYVLGPEDQITVRAISAEELSEKPFEIDGKGELNLPLVGRIRAGGLTVPEFEQELEARLKEYVVEPRVSVSVTEYRSQPVSIIGAVQRPGVQQLRGKRTLIEMLSLAGGPTNDAGYTVKITRRRESGALDLPGTIIDSSGQFATAQVQLKSIMEANNPDENILIKPFDVISVPRAEMVYVLGEVNKPGGFVLQERESLSVLQAVSLAQGLTPAANKTAKILRQVPGSPEKKEIPTNMKSILAGKSPDVPLQPNDILFVPNNAPRNAALRGLETAIQLGTGILIWRR